MSARRGEGLSGGCKAGLTLKEKDSFLLLPRPWSYNSVFLTRNYPSISTKSILSLVSLLLKSLSVLCVNSEHKGAIFSFTHQSADYIKSSISNKSFEIMCCTPLPQP